MIYVMLMTFFLGNGTVTVSHTTTKNRIECENFSVLVAKDEIRQHPDWNIQWLDVQCIKVKREII